MLSFEFSTIYDKIDTKLDQQMFLGVEQSILKCRQHKNGPASNLGLGLYKVHLIFVTAVQLKKVWALLNKYVKKSNKTFKDCFLKQ